MSIESKRLEYLRQYYQPHPNCILAGFECDWDGAMDGTKECPCRWALTEGRKEELALEHTGLANYRASLQERE